MAMEKFKIIRTHIEKCVLVSFFFKNNSNWNTRFILLLSEFQFALHSTNLCTAPIVLHFEI